MEVATYEAPLTEVRRAYASFWRRLAAAFVDGFLVRIAAGLAGAAMSGLVLDDLPVVEVVYAIGFIAYGATPAMHLLGVRVIDREGKMPGWRRSVVRYIIPAISAIPWYLAALWSEWLLDLQIPLLIVWGALSIVLVFLDALWMIWDDEKQMLHDKLASTWVIREQE